jgi:hypothetical protein
MLKLIFPTKHDNVNHYVMLCNILFLIVFNSCDLCKAFRSNEELFQILG